LQEHRNLEEFNRAMRFTLANLCCIINTAGSDRDPAERLIREIAPICGKDRARHLFAEDRGYFSFSSFHL